jgi:nitrate reductase gamma subunit
LTTLFWILTYLAAAVFIVGFIAKVWKYATTPAPLKIPQTPAPVTATWIPVRVLSEVAIFKSLFKSNRVLWLAGYLFHIGLLLAVMKHFRFFFTSTPDLLNYFTTYELYAGLIMLGGLGLLLLMRFFVDRHFFISVMTDFFLLILLISIAGTGLLAKHFFRVDLVHVKEFMLGIIAFNPQPFPTEIIFVIHFSLVLLLLVYFPFSKLMHAAGLFFSPTRNQVDNPREKRIVAPWAEKGPAPVEVVEEAPETA